MKSEIIEITTLWNNAKFKNEYQITIITEEKPNLKIGECEVKQNGR